MSELDHPPHIKQVLRYDKLCVFGSVGILAEQYMMRYVVARDLQPCIACRQQPIANRQQPMHFLLWEVSITVAITMDSYGQLHAINNSCFTTYSGREVAVYCATHLADTIKSTAAYGQGDLGQAMKDAFMQCDRFLKEKEAIAEMKKYDEDEISEEE